MSKHLVVRCASCLALLAAASALSAQTIRGTVLDAANGRPIADAAVVVVDASGRENPASATRTDARGAFVVYPPPTGRFGVTVTGAGYTAASSKPETLGAAEVVRLLIPMSTGSKPAGAITVVERRTMTARELASRSGFEVRRTRGIGRFADSVTLAGQSRIEDVAAPQCGNTAVALVLDGKLLPQAGPPSAGGPGWELVRATMVSDIAAVESYDAGRLSQLPPALVPTALVGQPGDQASGAGRCALTVWTKSYFAAMDSVIARDGSPPAAQPSARQIVRGRVLEFNTEAPVSDAQVSLVTADGEIAGAPVYSDELGRFSIVVARPGSYRVHAMRIGYGAIISRPYDVAANSISETEIHISRTAVVVAPLTVRERVLSRSDDMLDPMFGFEFRKANSLGTFLTRQQLNERHLTRFSATLSGIAGIVIRGDSILMRGDPRCQLPVQAADSAQIRVMLTALGCDPDLAKTGLCQPSLTLDGVPQTGDPAEVFRRLESFLPDGIEGIEVYSRALRVPGELMTASTYGCGAVAVWRAR